MPRVNPGACMASGRATRRSTFRISEQWHYLMNAPFKISDECCNEMKKKPMKRYAHETGRVPIIGTMAEESKLRTQHWLQRAATPTMPSGPLPSPCRSGRRPTCGSTSGKTTSRIPKYTTWLWPNRLYLLHVRRAFRRPAYPLPARLQRTHPKLWRYCMRGLGSGWPG